MSRKRMWVLEEQDDLGDGKDKGDKCQGQVFVETTGDLRARLVPC